MSDKTVRAKVDFLEQVREVIHANGWENELIAERIPSSAGSAQIRVRRKNSSNPPAPEDLVNLYSEDSGYIEQVQQECLRFLRTGRTGI